MDLIELATVLESVASCSGESYWRSALLDPSTKKG